GGTDFQHAVVTGETFVRDVQAIQAKRETASGECARIVGLVGTAKLGAVTGEFNLCFKGKPGRVGDLEAEFSAVALPQQRQGRKYECNASKQTHGLVGGSFHPTSPEDGNQRYGRIAARAVFTNFIHVFDKWPRRMRHSRSRSEQPQASGRSHERPDRRPSRPPSPEGNGEKLALTPQGVWAPFCVLGRIFSCAGTEFGTAWVRPLIPG